MLGGRGTQLQAMQLLLSCWLLAIGSCMAVAGARVGGRTDMDLVWLCVCMVVGGAMARPGMTTLCGRCCCCRSCFAAAACCQGSCQATLHSTTDPAAAGTKTGADSASC